MEITTTISEFLWHIFWVLSIALTMLVLCLVTQSCLTLPIPWAAAHQVPLSIGILHIRIPEWVAMPSSHGGSHALDLPNPGVKPRSPSLQVDSLPAEPLGKPKNTGVSRLSFLQWIFPTQETNQGVLCYRQILYQLSYQGSPAQSKLLLFKAIFILN